MKEIMFLWQICSLEDAMNPKNAYQNMVDTTEQAFRLIQTVWEVR